jgi:hypothetical protein
MFNRQRTTDPTQQMQKYVQQIREKIIPILGMCVTAKLNCDKAID